jgi:hypothetical protein
VAAPSAPCMAMIVTTAMMTTIGMMTTITTMADIAVAVASN